MSHSKVNHPHPKGCGFRYPCTPRSFMKFLFFFFLLFLIILPIATASSIERRIEVKDVYFNGSGVYMSLNKEYTITLTPTPYTDFNSPGYTTTEYLPRGFTFISTNADKHTLTDNKLQMLKFLPPSDNSTLIYKLQYKKEFDPMPSFYGTYLDENRVYGVITQYGTTTTSSSNAITRDSTPTVSYEKSNNNNVFKSSTNTVKLMSEFIPLSSSPVTIAPVTENSGIGILIFVIFFIILGVVFTALRPSYHRVFNVKLLNSGDVIIDKKAVGITKELKFELVTKSPLSVKIGGDISKVITSIREVPCDNRCYVIGISPDGKEHAGSITFIKKNTKNMKYNLKKQ